MIEVIYQLKLIIKVHLPNYYGKFQLKVLTIIITYRFSLMDVEKESTLIVHSQLWELMIC